MPPMSARLLGLLGLLLAAGCAEQSASAPPLEFCQGPVEFTWDPGAGERLNAFPDDTYTIIDGSTVTGLRVNLTPETAPWLLEQASPAADHFQQALPGMVVLGVDLEMFGEMLDSLGQESDLDFRRSRVRVVGAEVRDQVGLAFRV